MSCKIPSAKRPPMEVGAMHASRTFALEALTGFILLSVLTACSLTPKIYDTPPEHLEEIRSGLGVIGVALSDATAERKIDKPAKGALGGAARGVFVGATTPVVIGFFSPFIGGTAMGVMAAPFTAAAGSVYGAMAAAPAEDVEKAEKATAMAAAKLKVDHLRRIFLEEIVAQGNAKTGRKFVALPGIGPHTSDEIVRYDLMAADAVDTVFEISVKAVGLWGPYRVDPPLLAFMEVSARLINAHDNQVILAEDLICSSEKERTYIEWSEKEGCLFVDEFVACLPELAEKIIDDFFLLYPITSPEE